MKTKICDFRIDDYKGREWQVEKMRGGSNGDWIEKEHFFIKADDLVCYDISSIEAVGY
jgi:hypothetical protein